MYRSMRLLVGGLCKINYFYRPCACRKQAAWSCRTSWRTIVTSGFKMPTARWYDVIVKALAVPENKGKVGELINLQSFPISLA